MLLHTSDTLFATTWITYKTIIYFGLQQEPLHPTVLPAIDFDPDKDAARIETAIKTKGMIQLFV